MRYGAWETSELIAAWQAYVKEQGVWEEHDHAGYRAVSVDLVGFFRPKLRNWWSKHYHALSGRALPAVMFGVVVWVGQIGTQRVPLLRFLVRAGDDEATDVKLNRKTLKQVGQSLTDDEVAIVDAGFKLADLLDADIKRGVLRLAVNVTARRNKVAEYKGKGRPPTYGELVRPLARRRTGKLIPASKPDTISQFIYQDRTIVVKGWQDLILKGVIPGPENECFSIYVFEDPLYEQALVLAVTFELDAKITFGLYHDRWPVEQLPLAAKQMIGLHRQFVSARESCFRLPELALLAGGVMIYLATVLPPQPTGFWDRRPKATPGRLRRVLAKSEFPKESLFLPQVRKKQAMTDHLPKGIRAHRRSKTRT